MPTSAANTLPEIDEPVRVMAYSAWWPALFAAEHDRIVGALKLASDDLQHVGSTAVPGLAAKPIIDLMLGVADFPPPEPVVGSIIGLGYTALGEAGVPGRLYFRHRDEVWANLHVVGKGGRHWVCNLALRNLLRDDASASERYAQAKRAAIATGAVSLLAYSAAKSAIVEDLIRQALERHPALAPSTPVDAGGSQGLIDE